MTLEPEIERLNLDIETSDGPYGKDGEGHVASCWSRELTLSATLRAGAHCAFLSQPLAYFSSMAPIRWPVVSIAPCVWASWDWTLRCIDFFPQRGALGARGSFDESSHACLRKDEKKGVRWSVFQSIDHDRRVCLGSHMN